VYALCILLVAPLLYLFPTTRTAGVALAGTASIAALAVRIRRGRPRAPWVLIMIGSVFLTVGDAFFAVATTGTIAVALFPGPVDFFFLLAYLPFAVGLFWLTQPMPAGRTLMAFVDTALLSLAASLVIWMVVLRPAMRPAIPGHWSATVAIGGCVGFVAVLAAALSTLLESRRRVDVLLIAAGAAAFLVANVQFIQARAMDSWGPSVEVGFLLLAVTVAAGAAALLPPAPPEPTAHLRRGLGPTGLTAIAVALVATPTLLLAEATAGAVTAGFAIAVVALLEAVLVLVRLLVAAREVRRRSVRAEAVRTTARRLATAAGEAEVLTAVRAAVAAMLPPAGPRTVHLHRPPSPAAATAAPPLARDVADAEAEVAVQPVAADAHAVVAAEAEAADVAVADAEAEVAAEAADRSGSGAPRRPPAVTARPAGGKAADRTARDGAAAGPTVRVEARGSAADIVHRLSGDPGELRVSVPVARLDEVFPSVAAVLDQADGALSRVELTAAWRRPTGSTSSARSSPPAPTPSSSAAAAASSTPARRRSGSSAGTFVGSASTTWCGRTPAAARGGPTARTAPKAGWSGPAAPPSWSSTGGTWAATVPSAAS